MATRCIKKSAEKSGTKKQNLNVTKSNERFSNLRIDHKYSLLTMSEDNLNMLEHSESNLLHSFAELNKRIVCIPEDSFHSDYQLRAVAQFHGLEHIDSKGETNIYSRNKVTPKTTLANYLKSLKRAKKEKEKIADTDNTEKRIKISKSTERFQNLNIDLRYSLRNISERSLKFLEAYESSILLRFVEKKMRIACVPSGIFHSDYRLRAVTKYYGLEWAGMYYLRRRLVDYSAHAEEPEIIGHLKYYNRYVTDDDGEINICARYPIIPGTTLVNHLKSLKKYKSNSNKQ